MTFLEHLEELRRRLWVGLAFVAAGMVAAYVARRQLMTLIFQPFREAWLVVLEDGANLPGDPLIHYRNVTEPFFTDLTMAAVGGLYVGLPLLIWQLWLFVAPGLMPRERRYAIPFLLFSYVFFTLGVVFCYWAVLPIAYKFFFHYAHAMQPGLEVNPTIMIKDYVAFSLKLMAAFGITFELPLVVAFLTLLRIVDWRQLLRWTRFGVVGAFLVGALLTPADPLSMVMLAGPLIALYLISIGVSFLMWPKGHAELTGAADEGKKKKKTVRKEKKKRGD